MPNPRNELLVNGELYHVLNRSIANDEIFRGKRQLDRALELIDYYRYSQSLRFSKFKTMTFEEKEKYRRLFEKSKPLVEIYAFALMPNHYHILLKQIRDRGTSIFISNFQNSFAKYFNTKFDRSGGLFQRPFKAKRITGDEILLHISRYVHLNPITSYLVEYKDHESYPWTSYLNYLGKRNNDYVNTDYILRLAGSIKSYEDFISNQVDYQRALQIIKNYQLE